MSTHRSHVSIRWRSLSWLSAVLSCYSTKLLRSARWVQQLRSANNAHFSATPFPFTSTSLPLTKFIDIICHSKKNFFSSFFIFLFTLFFLKNFFFLHATSLVTKSQLFLWHATSTTDIRVTTIAFASTKNLQQTLNDNTVITTAGNG